jgi:hypothetical protein
LFTPGANDVLAMLLLSVLAAFCAAESTDEKKPPGGLVPGLDAGFSRVGVKGTDVMLDSLLGPRVLVPDLTRRWDSIFPEGDTTTSELAAGGSGSETPRSRAKECSPSIGVGGVFTMTGAGLSPAGGVCGRIFVSMALGSFAVLGRSCELVAEGRMNSLLGKMAPILDATLPRLPVCVSICPSSGVPAPLPPPFVIFRSGLVFGPRRGVNASRSLLTGEGDLSIEPTDAGRREAVVRDGEDCAAAVVAAFKGNVANLVPSS